MRTDSQVEHFVTLFDSNYLPQGMALHNSLMIHGQPFHLWIVCMDEQVGRQLAQISLPNVTLIQLSEIETKKLLEVKKGRTVGEYCWTLTPFTFSAVFRHDTSVERVTYLDSDISFFASPHILLSELEASGKHVLITEHAYAPEYGKWLPLSGRFCVQFLTFRKTQEAKKVLHWWQERCLEWCFARFEEGKFGDQKYLDSWPEIFADEVHVVQQKERTLAPWNIKYYAELLRGKLDPVFYHFHSLSIISPNKIHLYRSYEIGKDGLRLYDAYLRTLTECFKRLQELDIKIPYRAEDVHRPVTLWSMIKRQLRFNKPRTSEYRVIN